MILNSDNWQPSIKRSVRGNSSYRFENQVFDADIDKLKIETLIVNSSVQNQILPCTLTVIYEKNIEDDIFSIPTGYPRSIATLIDNLKPYSFKLKLDNPNKSPLSITAYKPKLRRLPIPTNPMPLYGQDDTALNALIAATTANTAAITAMASTNPSADAIADAIANNSVITPQATVTPVGTSLISVLAKSLNTQKVTIKNLANTKVKIWMSDTVPVLSSPGTIIYSTPGETVELVANSGVYEVPDALCKSGVYAISSGVSGSISITRTYTN